MDNCFVGVNSIIMPGVIIGPNSIVGAGSVVTRSVAPNSVVAGNPARPLMPLEQYIERYRREMIALVSENRTGLKRELASLLLGQVAK